MTVEYFQLPFGRDTFGNRFGIKGPFYGPQGHRGTDFIRPAGTPIPAVAAGIVVQVFWSDVLGNVTVLRHARPGGRRTVYSGYCHQSSILCREGQKVARGKIIGRVGTTGSASTGNHLHLTMSHEEDGVRWGEVFDPIVFIDDNDRTSMNPPVTPPSGARYTTARPGEGLGAIAARSKVSLARVKQLNPSVESPDYLVRVGQRVRVA